MNYLAKSEIELELIYRYQTSNEQFLLLWRRFEGPAPPAASSGHWADHSTPVFARLPSRRGEMRLPHHQRLVLDRRCEAVVPPRDEPHGGDDTHDFGDLFFVPIAAQVAEHRVGCAVGDRARRKRELQRRPFGRREQRTCTEIPDSSELGIVHAEVERAAGGMSLAIAAAGDARRHMRDQPLEPTVDLAVRFPQRRLQRHECLQQLGLALHGQRTVGNEPERAAERIEQRLELRRVLGRQRLQSDSGHAILVYVRSLSASCEPGRARLALSQGSSLRNAARSYFI